MTRAKEITKEAKKFAKEIDDWEIAEDVQDAFEQGARWADAHPDIDVRTMAAWQSGYNEGIGKSRWISVEEELPEEGCHVLAVREGGLDMGIYEFLGEDQWEAAPNYIACVDDITHWMPLPSVEHLRETTKMIEKGGKE